MRDLAMSGLQMLVLADDLTGALEVGARLAVRGLAVRVVAGQSAESPGPDDAAQVLVIDTETRHLPAATAGDVIHRLMRAAHWMHVRCIYKKTDSTLRGNVGSELQALLRAFPGQPLVYAPAYPQLGRTVRNGILFVDGTPVSGTAFAVDPLNPVRESHIPTLLANSGCPVAVLCGDAAEVGDSSAPGIYVVDGERDEDVCMAARSFAASVKLRLAAGPAVFADYLAGFISRPHGDRCPWPVIRKCLVVNGSLHQVSEQQVRFAKGLGWTSRGPETMQDACARPDWIILDLPKSEGLAGLELARRIGEIVNGLLELHEFDAVAVFGGDTAFAILQASGGPPLHPLGEVLPGVPLSRIGAAGSGRHNRGLERFLITKAGGFGPVDLLPALKAVLSPI